MRAYLALAGTGGAVWFCLAGLVATERASAAPPLVGAPGSHAFMVAGHHGDDTDRFVVRDTEEIRKSFPAAAKNFGVEIQDLNGSIRVVGRDGDEIQVVAHRVNRARSRAALDEAKERFRIEMHAEDDRLTIRAGMPQDWDHSQHDWDSSDRDWEVHVDFEVQVPRDVEVRLRTVNDGDIDVSGVRGGFDVENVNGDVTMSDMGGSGRVYALNGEVRVTFERNPSEESYFGSLNGDIEVGFRGDLSADLQFATRNGEAYADFPMTQTGGLPPEHERRGHKNVYRIEAGFRSRVGRGGPNLRFDAFNGDIRVVNRDH